MVIDGANLAFWQGGDTVVPVSHGCSVGAAMMQFLMIIAFHQDLLFENRLRNSKKKESAFPHPRKGLAKEICSTFMALPSVSTSPGGKTDSEFTLARDLQQCIKQGSFTHQHTRNRFHISIIWLYWLTPLNCAIWLEFLKPGSKVVTLINLHFYYHKAWKHEAKSVLLVKTHQC